MNVIRGIPSKLWFAFALLVLASPHANAQTNDPGAKDAIAAALSKVDRDIDGFKQQQFVAFDPNYQKERALREARLVVLARQIRMREASGQDVQSAHSLLKEAGWLLEATADFKRVDQRTDDLASLLASPTTMPQELNGLTLWFYQLDFAYDQLDRDKQFEFPSLLLDRINSPQKLTAYFTSVSVSDIAHEGIDHQEELNEPLADLTRLIIRDNRPATYAYDSQLKETLLDLILHRLRDPTTGYWGERYVVDGGVRFIPDLSTTFHVISYLRGEVPELDKVIDTTLAVKDRDTPVGWLSDGHEYDHNSMDVVQIFKWGWPHARPDQKQEMASEIQKMIDRCLTESLQPDGSFKPPSISGSIEETTYFGVSFLASAGFFDPSKRFWTDRDFPAAEPIRQRLIDFIDKHKSSGAAGGGYYQSALDALNVHQDKRPD